MNFLLFLPELTLAAVAFVVLAIDLVTPSRKKMDFDSCECFRINCSLTGFNIIFIWKTGIIV